MFFVKIFLYTYVVILLYGDIMKKYVTISIPAEVKKVLESVKGDEEWGVFLLRLYKEFKRLKSQEAFKNLKEVLSEEDLSSIVMSSKEFRNEFSFRSTIS